MSNQVGTVPPPPQERRSRMRPALAVVFGASILGLIGLTLRLPNVLARKPSAVALLWSALALLLLTLVVAGIAVWYLASKLRHAAGEYRRVQGIVQSATGASIQLPDPAPRSRQRILIAVIVGLPVFALLVHFAIRHLFPEAPSWAPMVAIWGGAVVAMLLAYAKSSAPGEVEHDRRSLWRALANMTFWLAAFMLLMRFDPKWVTPYVGPNAFVLLMLLLCLSIPFVLWASGLAPLWWVGRALARADYRTAEHRAALLLRFSQRNAGLHFLRGTVLLLAGRYAEAERALRASAELPDVSATYSQSATLANLGDALLLQGRYDEAIRSFEAAAQICEAWGRAYSGMAEAHLWREMEPERALLLIDRALKRKLRTWISRNGDRHVLAHMYADRAWALALEGRDAEMREDLDRAFRAARRRFRPGLAGVHYRAGRAFLAGKDRVQAAEHFRRAMELDPGSNGIQAGLMLSDAH